MSKTFSISAKMSEKLSQNTEKVKELKDRENFNLKFINIEEIVPNKKNFYGIREIEELAEDMDINGLSHNLVVREIANKKYEIISGERRYSAAKLLLDNNNNKFKTLPCKIITVNELDGEITLIQTNSLTRDANEYEKLTAVKRLTELYKEKKKRGEKVPGKIRDIIASDLNMSPTQVGRYSSISKNLNQGLTEQIKDGNLTVSAASEIATLSEENQNKILDAIKNDAELTKEDAINLRKEINNIENQSELSEDEKHEEIDKTISTLANKKNQNNINTDVDINKKCLANIKKAYKALSGNNDLIKNISNTEAIVNELIKLEILLNELKEKLK